MEPDQIAYWVKICISFGISGILILLFVIMVIGCVYYRTEKETEDDVRADNPTGSTTSAASITVENTSSNVLINVPAPLPPSPQYYSSECCVCLDRPATVWGQCGHVCWCSDCALTALIKSNDHTMMLHCPLCRQNSTLITAL